MSTTRDWMRSEHPAHGRNAALAGAGVTSDKPGRSPLELTLMGAGLLAWLWCAYEVALLVIR